METPVFNVTSSNTTYLSTTSQPAQSTTYSILFHVMQVYCVLLIIVGAVGNVCVLIVFVSRWKRLRTYELFFISLAIADLLGTLVYPNYKLLDLRGTKFSVEGCRTVFFLNHVSITVSSLTLTAVSVDRCIAIKWSRWSSADRRNLYKGLIPLIWVASAGFALVFLVGKSMQEHHGKCRMNKNRTLEIVWTTVATYSLQNFIPITVMIFLYSLIIYELYKSFEECRRFLTPANFRFRRMKNRRTTQLLIIVVVVFFVCVTPKTLFYIFYINNMFGMDRENPTDTILIVNSVLNMLKMTNACVNPIIYSRLHTSFRKRMVSFVGSRFKVRKLYRRRASTLEDDNNQTSLLSPNSCTISGKLLYGKSRGSDDVRMALLCKETQE